MPRLPALTPQRAIEALEKRGFVLDRVRGSHHIRYHAQTQRRAVVRVHELTTLENIDAIGNDLDMNEGGGYGKGDQMPPACLQRQPPELDGEVACGGRAKK